MILTGGHQKTIEVVLGPMVQFRCEVAGSACCAFAAVAASATGANMAAQAAVPVKTVATLNAFLIDSSSRGRVSGASKLAPPRDIRVISA